MTSNDYSGQKPGKTLLVVGWDAATRGHLETFDLPFYSSLDHGDRLLPEPFWQGREVDSGAAWTTITTGKSMWDHRVASLSGRIERPELLRAFSTVDRIIPRNLLGVPARIWARRLFLGDPPSNADVPYRRLWHYVPDSLAFGVPLTYPPKPTDGVTVSGFPSPDVQVQPKHLQEPVRDRYDGEPDRKFDDGGVRDGYIEDLFVAHNGAVDAVRWLVERREFDLHFVVFTLLDRLLHVVDAGDDRIERAYRRLDATTGELARAVDPDDVLVLSDHGMRYAPRWKWRHVHDERTGIWASTRDFGLETHLDITPAVCDYFGVSTDEDHYSLPSGDIDQSELRNQLENLGYL